MMFIKLSLLFLLNLNASFFSLIQCLLLNELPSLQKLAEKLVREGPHKVEATPRRVRGLLGGRYVCDTLKASYVWEHPYCKSALQ
jgi:hypothetical protein